MGNTFTSFRRQEVDATGKLKNSLSWMGGPTFDRIRLTTSGLASTTVVEATKVDSQWTGTETTRPLHVVPALESVKPFTIPTLQVQLERADTVDAKIAVMQHAPLWLKTNDLDVVRDLGQVRLSVSQRHALKNTLSTEQYQQLAVAILERDSPE